MTYSDNLNGISRYVEAYIKYGCLEIEGQDLGGKVLGGDGEYEYFFSFDEVETKRFSELLINESKNFEFFLVVFVKHINRSKWYLSSLNLRRITHSWNSVKKTISVIHFSVYKYSKYLIIISHKYRAIS